MGKGRDIYLARVSLLSSASEVGRNMWRRKRLKLESSCK